MELTDQRLPHLDLHKVKGKFQISDVSLQVTSRILRRGDQLHKQQAGSGENTGFLRVISYRIVKVSEEHAASFFKVSSQNYGANISLRKSVFIHRTTIRQIPAYSIARC